ncbi:MAG: hypothetical protein J5931_11045 [Prevotella sp.]|nr:hypothetical protein [Prevotella sp.]
MKKLSIFAVALAAMVFAACGGNKSGNTVDTNDSIKSFEQAQIEAAIKMHVDSLASEMGKLKKLPMIQASNGAIKLTKEELQVKPDYLINPAAAENATTLAEKYRLLAALQVDKETALLYEMPIDEYDKAIAKLAADINDPSFKAVEEDAPISETTEALYNAMNENGRINYFWQIAAASLIEQLYLANQNQDKFLAAFDDETAANSTFRIVLILDALDRLSEYDSDIKPVADALAPLDVLNATTVDELKTQLAEAKDKIIAARQALVK